MHIRNCLHLYCTQNSIVDVGFGAAYGTAKSGVGICSMGVLRPDLIIKNVVPVIMAGIIGIYGLVVAVLVSDGRTCPIILHLLHFRHFTLWRLILELYCYSVSVICVSRDCV